MSENETMTSDEFEKRRIEEQTAKDMFREAGERLQALNPEKQPTQWHEAVIAWQNAERRMIKLGLAGN